MGNIDFLRTQEWAKEWADETIRRITELEDKLANADMTRRYLRQENLRLEKELFVLWNASTAAKATDRLRERILELEERLLDTDKITTHEIARQQKRILELESQAVWLKKMLAKAVAGGGEIDVQNQM